MGKKAYKQLTKINSKKEKPQSMLGIYIQVGLTLAAMILFIVYLFKSEMLVYLQITFAIDLFMMAYNNHTRYKRKFFSILYLLFGLCILGFVIAGWVGA